jgi:hypothetical protein
VLELGAERLEEPLQGVLGAAVRRLEGDAAVGERGSDLDDRPPVPRHHPAQGRHRPPDRAEIRDLGHPAVLLRRRLGHRRQHGGHRVRHPHVDRAERRLDLRGGGLDPLGIGDVGFDRDRPPTERLDLRPRTLEALSAAGDQPHVGAVTGKRPGGGAPDSRRRAGDDDDLGHLVI